MARRRRRIPPDAHFWVQVRSRLFCMLGSHDVAAGQWVRYRRGDVRRFASCETCLAERGIERPHRSFTFTREDAEDVRKRQVGGGDE